MNLLFLLQLVIAALILISSYRVDCAYCFDDKKTHPELTKFAIENSKITARICENPIRS